MQTYFRLLVGFIGCFQHIQIHAIFFLLVGYLLDVFFDFAEYGRIPCAFTWGGMNLDPEYLVNMKDLGFGGSTWRFGLWLDLIFGGSGSQVTNFEHLQQDSQFLQGGPRTDK